MNLILDLVILLALVAAAYLGYRKGFVLTLCSFLAIFVAFLGAWFLSDLLCQPVGRLIQPALEAGIHELFYQEFNPQEIIQYPAPAEDSSAAAPGDTADAETQEDAEENPQEEPAPTGLYFSQILDLLEQNKWLAGAVEALREQLAQSVTHSADQAVHAVADYLAREIARIFLFIVAFFLVMILWWLFSHALDLAFRLPVLSTINAVSGLILGLLKGMLLVFIAAWLLKGHLFTQQLMDQTVLLRFFAENSPVSLLLDFLSRG